MGLIPESVIEEESFYAANAGAYKLLELKNRARQEAKLPEIVPVDMKEQVKLGSGDMLSHHR